MMPHLHLLLACLAASPAVLADLQPIRRQSWPAGPSEQQQPQSSQQPSKDPNTSDSAPKSLSLGLKHANMPNSLDGLRQMVEHGRDRFRGLFPNGHDGSALGDGGQGLKERQDEDDGSGNPQEPATKCAFLPRRTTSRSLAHALTLSLALLSFNSLQITFLAELGVGAGTYDLIVDSQSEPCAGWAQEHTAPDETLFHSQLFLQLEAPTLGSALNATTPTSPPTPPP